MKIYNRRRISRQKYTILFASFVADIASCTTAEIVGVNRKTADRYYGLFREVLLRAATRERYAQNLHNGIEIDESYFGAHRVRGKRGRGAGGWDTH